MLRRTLSGSHYSAKKELEEYPNSRLGNGMSILAVCISNELIGSNWNSDFSNSSSSLDLGLRIEKILHLPSPN